MSDFRSRNFLRVHLGACWQKPSSSAPGFFFQLPLESPQAQINLACPHPHLYTKKLKNPKFNWMKHRLKMWPKPTLEKIHGDDFPGGPLPQFYLRGHSTNFNFRYEWLNLKTSRSLRTIKRLSRRIMSWKQLTSWCHHKKTVHTDKTSLWRIAKCPVCEYIWQNLELSKGELQTLTQGKTKGFDNSAWVCDKSIAHKIS